MLFEESEWMGERERRIGYDWGYKETVQIGDLWRWLSRGFV